IAFNPKPILREYADVVITIKDLRAVIPVLESLSYQFCNQAQHVDIEHY
ncbi:MAG: phosphoserine phosphatase SerB, partial [Methanosarcina sp.]